MSRDEQSVLVVSYEELKHCLRAVGVKVLIAADSFKNLNYFDILRKIDSNFLNGEAGQLKSDVLPELKSIVNISDSSIS